MKPASPTTLTAMLSRPYRYIRLEWNAELAALRVRTCVKPIQCYSLAAMGELQRVFSDIAESGGLVKHFVMTSDVPGVFNFGGDLSLFVLLIRARDLDSLRMYGRRCVDLVWWMENASQLGVHTTVLVQGDTLGGGTIPRADVAALTVAVLGHAATLNKTFEVAGDKKAPPDPATWRGQLAALQRD